ncbi:MAG: hypothetical protein ACRBB0_26655 [Pelagimonas sp.]|uniref:hypothetical protein n=1 Tax=Pelagimonas sp. TaxID=2073170 RepID=UPI003D6A2BAC
MRDVTVDEFIAAKAADKRQLDFDDLQREITGQDGARMKRFLSSDDPRSMTAEKKRQKERAFRDLLDRLLEDPEYRALYEDLGNKLRDTETQTDTAIALVEAKLQDADQLIDDMERRAAKDPDGRPVFRYADGRVVDANDEELPPEIAAGIQWPDNAPTAEDYFIAKSRRNDLAAHLEELQSYRNDVLGNIRHRYDDRDNPMSKEDIREALEEIETSSPNFVGLNRTGENLGAPNALVVSASLIPNALN